MRDPNCGGMGPDKSLRLLRFRIWREERLASEEESVPVIEVSVIKSSPEKRPRRETLTTRPTELQATPSHLVQQSVE